MPFEEMVRIHVGLLSVRVVNVRDGRRTKRKHAATYATPAAESVAQCILRARAVAGKDRRQALVSPAETKEMH
jgi:hypothetical protein